MTSTGSFLTVLGQPHIRIFYFHRFRVKAVKQNIKTKAGITVIIETKRKAIK